MSLPWYKLSNSTLSHFVKISRRKKMKTKKPREIKMQEFPSFFSSFLSRAQTLATYL